MPAKVARSLFHETIMKYTQLVLACTAGAFVHVAPAQSVKVSPSTLVAVSPPDHAITEPHLAIDPSHPERLVGAVYQASKPGLRFPAGQDEQTCAAFVSGDSGATWVKHEFNMTWCADPSRRARVAATISDSLAYREDASDCSGPRRATGYDSSGLRSSRSRRPTHESVGWDARLIRFTSRSASCSCRARRAAWRCHFRSPRCG